MTNGWKLDRGERDKLLRDHPPRYAEAVADHVTLDIRKSDPPHEVKGAIVGRTDDDKGVEAMVVTVDGTVDRPDGSTYHITWSLGPRRKAKESNDLLREKRWDRIDRPIDLDLAPACFKW